MRFAILLGLVYIGNSISVNQQHPVTIVFMAFCVVFSLIMDLAEYGQNSRK